MKKICENPACCATFETDSKKKRFCSDRCRVAYGRSLAKGDVTTADKIPVPPAKIEDKKVALPADYLAVKNIKLELPSWAKAIEDYCNKSGCMPSDLIDAHQNKSTSSIGQKKGKDSKIKESGKSDETPAGETYMEKRLRLKNTGSKS